MIRKIQNKILKKQNTITLEHYSLEFKTVDGEIHSYTKMCYGDPDSVLCSLGEFYLHQQGKYIKDDEGVIYPIKNIVWIKSSVDDVIPNVIKQYSACDFERIWYPDFELKTN